MCHGRLKWSAWFLNVQTSHLSCKPALRKGQFDTVVLCCDLLHFRVPCYTEKSGLELHWHCGKQTICVLHSSAVHFFSPPILIWKYFYFISLLLINFVADSMKLDFVAVFSVCSLKYIYVFCCSVKVCDTFLQKIYLPFCMADEFGCVINFFFIVT